jgi:YVTN family beta-propeller protein
LEKKSMKKSVARTPMMRTSFFSAIAAALMLASPAAPQEIGYRMYVANEYGADISVIDTLTNTIVETIKISGRPGEVRPRGMAVSADGGTIYVAISDFNTQFETPEDKIIAIDVRTNKVLSEFHAGGNPERLALNPEGTKIWASLEALARAGGYDIATGAQFTVFRVGVEPEGVAVSPNGRWVYVPPKPPIRSPFWTPPTTAW